MQEHSFSERLVAGLAYLSILFLPVLFPLVTWIMAKDTPYVHRHARRAFWAQLFPLILIIIVSVIYFGLGALGGYSMRFQAGWIGATLVALMILVSLALYLYNIAMAIMVFLDRR